MSENYIFALDIGTRSVVGVVMQETVKGLEIIAAEHLEHPSRAMVDGQIHDIEQVAKAIRIIKEKLENKIGQKLTQVAVAAAGRALKTVRLKVNAESVDYKEIRKDDILRLELQAVQEAQIKLLDSRDEASTEELYNYHCVGYSVVFYELDGYKIGNLMGQKGKNIAVEVIATFLPRVVVDSLFAALHRVELEMMSLTLEPIAASAVVVPPSMRQLNIALVDVGAGTSDIAVTDDGAIVGFGMVPTAGDEITERISHHYLLDFNQAEVIKRAVHNNEEISFSDILGLEHKVAKSELLDVISETVQGLARQISEKIMKLNGRTPQAVICIGGGSMTPLLKDTLADELGLSKQRVAIRGREAISEVFGAQELVGPEAVTPIGIAVTAYEHKGLGFARVMVNNLQVRLFEINKGTVADALLGAGVNMRKTQPRLGMALTVVVNGELKIIKGGRGTAAIIKLNGQEVTIDSPVKHDDIIEFVEAEDGPDAKGSIYDVVPQIMPVSITVNGDEMTINPVVTMNGQPVAFHEELVDNARINYYLPKTAAEVLEIAGVEDTDYIIYINERVVDGMSEIEDGDDIVVEKIAVQEVAEKNELGQEVSFGNIKDNEISDNFSESDVPGSESDIPDVESYVPDAESYVQGSIEALAAVEEVVSGITVVYVNQERVEIPRDNIILTDILTRVSFPLTPPQIGAKLVLVVNEAPAEFTTPLKWGDKVVLEWL